MSDPMPRVLIVDDEGPLLSNLQRAAAGRGLRVDTAANGREAWELICRRRFDLVVTDLRMPEMDGAELLARIHQQGLSTRVMVITGHATLDAAVDCLRKGAVDFLANPFEVETFLDCVAHALQRPAPARDDRELEWGLVNQQLRLTSRQGEILQAFYRSGKSNRALAEELCVAPSTIKSHLKVAFQRAGVTTRAQLMRRLRQIGRPDGG